MVRIPIIRLGRGRPDQRPPKLASYRPEFSFRGLQVGVDNLRHDVHLSRKFVEQMRLHVSRLIIRHADLEGILDAQTVDAAKQNLPGGLRPATMSSRAAASDLKPLLSDLLVGSVNRAKVSGSIAVDLLGRTAILKFLKLELNSQFLLLLERGRTKLKSYEGMRSDRAVEFRERISQFQVNKKIILRKTSQDLFRTVREIEKETLARMRRSLFGADQEHTYALFLNPLVFSEDGRDPYLNAEHYVMLGNFDRDPDRFMRIRELFISFVSSLTGQGAIEESAMEGWLNVPENAQELVAAGQPDDATEAGQGQRLRLTAWLSLLERENVMDWVAASYEIVPLLSEYSPRINPQQLKNGLISREERERVEKLIAEHGRLSPESWYSAMARFSACKGSERAKVAGRFMRDFLRYHRDLRRLEALSSGLDAVNLIGSDRIQELSAMNGTLYEFLLAEEQKPASDKISRHVIIKADVRDSTKLTRMLLERGMNPASYFSLNFYDPVNKLLAKYEATKVFAEGDALILALLEHDGKASLPVSRACVLAREIIEIVRGYNHLLQRAGLPSLELGIGISFQDSPPMYLMDGDRQIMISDALNESDRLSSCNKRVRKMLNAVDTPFNVHAFQTAEVQESDEDLIVKYNLNGIKMSEAAFARLQQEMSIEACPPGVTNSWDSETSQLYYAVVPIGNDIFRKILVRVGRIPRIDPVSFALQRWTDQRYFEVCSNPEVYASFEAKTAVPK